MVIASSEIIVELDTSVKNVMKATTAKTKEVETKDTEKV